MQNIVEGCSSRFESQVLVVATGQSALTATPDAPEAHRPVRRPGRALGHRRRDRRPRGRAAQEARARRRHRRRRSTRSAARSTGTSAARSSQPKGADKADARRRLPAAADPAPVLGARPARHRPGRQGRRAAHPAEDRARGRAQRRRPAARHTSIGADFVFRSRVAPSMLQSGVLLKEIDELIRGLDDGTADGELKSRACALVFLISQLPQRRGRRHRSARDRAVPRRPPRRGPRQRRRQAPQGRPALLDELVDEGRVVKLGDEFRLQTEEGAEWTKEFNQRRASIRDDAARMSQLRNEWLQRAVDAELAGLKLVHGESKTPRKLDRHWGEDDARDRRRHAIPSGSATSGRSPRRRSEKAAAEAGNESPIVFVLLPKLDADAIRDTLASYAAAADTISQRPGPQTDEGRQAKQGMQSRSSRPSERLTRPVRRGDREGERLPGRRQRAHHHARCALGVETAASHAQPAVPEVRRRRQPRLGARSSRRRATAPPTPRVRRLDRRSARRTPSARKCSPRITGGGTKGSDLQRDLGEPPFGWPKDAVDGALLALLASGNIRADPGRPGPSAARRSFRAPRSARPRSTRRTSRRARPSAWPCAACLPRPACRITPDQEGAAISGLLQHLVDLAHRAGGAAPLPAPPRHRASGRFGSSRRQ